jgi:hypothetical protein
MIGFTGKIMVGLNAKYCKNTIIFYYAYGVWALLQKKRRHDWLTGKIMVYK